MFYETAVEATFPIGEGSTVCLLTVANNFGCLIFLFLPNVSVLYNHPMWANWSLVVACLLGCVILIPFSQNYRRTDFDEGKDDDDEEKVALLGNSVNVN